MFVCTGDGTIRTFKEVAGGSVPVKDKDFTYSGNCEVIDDSTEMGVNWRIKFLTSGILKFADNIAIDVFLVGGGGGGRYGFTDKQGAATTVNRGAGGGGGGYTKTLSNIILTGDISYTIVIGDGGNYGSSGNGRPGGNTSISEITNGSVTGGNGGGNNSDNADVNSRGGDGGSVRQPRRPACGEHRQPVLIHGGKERQQKANPAAPFPQAVRCHRRLGGGRFPLGERSD